MQGVMRGAAASGCYCAGPSKSNGSVHTPHGRLLTGSVVYPPQAGRCRRTLVVVAGERQTGNIATKRRLSGPGLPPINGDDGGGGGGGGGDGWNWERTARNLLPNAVFLGMYFMITSYGGDGWGGGNQSGGGGGGGGGDGGGWGDAGAPQPDGGSPLQEDGAGKDGEEEGSSRATHVQSDDEEPPVYVSRGSSSRSHYR